MNFTLRFMIIGVIVACFINLSTQDESLNRVRRADDDEPSQEDIDAVRASLDKRAKVARPAYSPPPEEKKDGKKDVKSEVVETKKELTPLAVGPVAANPSGRSFGGSSVYGTKGGSKGGKKSIFKSPTAKYRGTGGVKSTKSRYQTAPLNVDFQSQRQSPVVQSKIRNW